MLSSITKQTLIAEIQFPHRNWRYAYGSGCVPGEEGDACATQLLMPDYEDEETIMCLVASLPKNKQDAFANNLLSFVNNDEPSTPVQRMDALLLAFGILPLP